MATIRVQPVATTTTAIGTVSGVLAVASTVGIPRHAVLNVSHASGGWQVEVVRITGATSLHARMTGFTADAEGRPGIFNRQDLTAIPNGATVSMPEQWVADMYSDDVPDTLAIPVK